MKTKEELAYCGEDCEECNIYQATVYREELKPETVKRWQEDFKKYHGIDLLDPNLLKCRGCRYEGLDIFYGFKLCPVRHCCKTRGLNSCGLCPEWQMCQWQPEGRKNLERINEKEK
jgi:hypothetical protein